jgi:hypothetical protein
MYSMLENKLERHTERFDPHIRERGKPNEGNGLVGSSSAQIVYADLARAARTLVIAKMPSDR